MAIDPIIDPIDAAIVLLAGLIGWLGTGLVIRHAHRWHLVQAPNHRSSHVAPTPHGGGCGIALAGLLAALPLALRGAPELIWIALLGVALALVGLRDDIRHVPARTRLLIQLLVCALLLALLRDWPPGIASAPLLLALLVAGAWWINLFNFMDGIDGLAASQALFMLVCGGALTFGFAALPAGATGVPIWGLAVAAATAGFLLLNWPPARIFMGDVGSTYLAFVILVLALHSGFHGALHWSVWPVLGAVFVTDATVTLLRRWAGGQSWLQPHRSHAYQQLARRWRSHRAVTLTVIGIDLLWLLPLALAVCLSPQRAALWLGLAYAPLLPWVLWAGAGRAEVR